MNEELKPCPFCGGTPEITADNPTTDAGEIVIGWRLKCDCGFRRNAQSEYRMLNTGIFQNRIDGRSELVEWWNRRTDNEHN